ncbi:MAG: hypothetical protein FWE05_12940 [Defluviitaleaceae bacterium]|nr:hypothetical protein [Defluviitaleaceae bacterium]
MATFLFYALGFKSPIHHQRRLERIGMYSTKGRYDVYPIFVGRISICGTND